MRSGVRSVILDHVRCVIVDDSPSVITAARRLLERDGFTIAGVATNAADAVRTIEEIRPDVALVDIDLGGESGFELARRLAPTTVILISTHAAGDYVDLVEASPAAGFLAKSDLSASAVRAILSAPRGT
jgi:DNA-binding NarL/FixJ family response regulator